MKAVNQVKGFRDLVWGAEGGASLEFWGFEMLSGLLLQNHAPPGVISSPVFGSVFSLGLQMAQCRHYL